MAYNSGESAVAEVDSGRGVSLRTSSKFQVPSSIFAEPNMDTVKRSLTLNVTNPEHLGSVGLGAVSIPSLHTPQLSVTGSLAGQSPGAMMNGQLLRAHALIPQILESPDLKMLALASPELERMLAVLSPMHSPFSSARPTSVDDADVLNALNDLYQRSRQAANASSEKTSMPRNGLNANHNGQNNQNADGVKGGKTEADGVSVIRPIPLRASAVSSKGKSPSESEVRSPTGNNSLVLDTAKRLTAFVHDANKVLAAVAGKTVGTPSSECGTLNTFMLLDAAQPQGVLGANVLPLCPTSQPVLLTALPGGLVQLAGLNVGAPKEPKEPKACEDERNTPALHQQSAISSSSNSKMRQSGRRAAPRRDTALSASSVTAASTSSTHGSCSSKTMDLDCAPRASKRSAQLQSSAEDDEDDDDDDELPRRGHSTTRRNEQELNPVERTKLTRKRERNRLAAQRCRERKVKRIDELQTVVSKLENEKGELRERLSQLTRDVETLQRRIEAHEQTGCRVPLLVSQAVAAVVASDADDDCK